MRRVFALLAALVLASLAHAQDVRTLKVGDIDVTATYVWPETLTRGWFPVHVRLENRGGEARDVGLDAHGGPGYGIRVRHGVTLAAGASTELELLCEANPFSDSEYSVRVSVGTLNYQLPQLGPSTYPSGPVSAHVVVSSSTSAPRFAEWTTSVASVRAHELHLVPGVDALSRRSEAYSSLTSVALDLAGGLPDDERLATLLTWVRCGGRLVLFGTGAFSIAREEAALATWMQERFRLESGEIDAWSIGHGRLSIAERVPFTHSVHLAFLTAPPSTPEHNVLQLGLDELPVRALTALLILFAILIGPVNFILVKRSGRPTLLLVTVPGIALAASLLLVVYATFAQGLSVRSASSTWTVLDQRGALAMTREVRAIYAGVSPGAGLRPQAGTTVMPSVARDMQAAYATNRSIDLRDGVLLAGDHLRVRVEQEQRLQTERTSRARLDVRVENGRVVVTNGLGAPVRDIWVKLEDGTVHSHSNWLAEGASASPTPVTMAETPTLGLQLGQRGSPTALPRGTWMGHLERSPFSDDCGLELEELASSHQVLGILATAEDTR